MAVQHLLRVGPIILKAVLMFKSRDILRELGSLQTIDGGTALHIRERVCRRVRKRLLLNSSPV